MQTSRSRQPPGHPAAALDDVVHQRARLGILAVAAQARDVEFTEMRGVLGLTAGNLSQHLGVLERAGLVRLDKGYAGRRPRTTVRLTPAGRTALRAELAALKALIARLEAGAARRG